MSLRENLWSSIESLFDLLDKLIVVRTFKCSLNKGKALSLLGTRSHWVVVHTPENVEKRGLIHNNTFML